MRFDWYEWTADGLDDGRVPSALALALGGRIVQAKPRNGYGRAVSIQVGDDVLATVFGGSARPGEVHVSITGGACDVAVPVCRRLWPAHRVSRADAAVDFLADFGPLDERAIAFAAARKIRHESIVNSEGGATRYLGARTSEVRIRLYKKTEQLRQQHPDIASSIPDGIVRLEVQARPGKRAVREHLAILEPGDVFGLGEWARDFAQDLLRLDPVRTATHFRRPSDWQRALHYLGLQYGPSVQARAKDVGWDQAMLEVLAALGLTGGHE